MVEHPVRGGRTAGSIPAYSTSIVDLMPYSDREAQLAAQRDHYARKKQQYKDRNKERRALFRQIIIDAKNIPCADCRQQYHYVCMDFDHLPQHEKSFSVGHGLGSASSERVLREEIAKCEVVCSNCHRLRTFNRGYGN